MKNAICTSVTSGISLRFILLPMVLSCVLCSTASFTASAQAELLLDINQSDNLTYNEFSNLRDGFGKAYYVSEGQHLWISFATDSGKVEQKLASFVHIDQLVMVGRTLYFFADDGSRGEELWKSNGTEAGTVIIKDIWPGRGSSAPRKLTAGNGLLYFTATDNVHGRELWKSNGSPAGTTLVKDIFPKLKNSNPAFLTNVNGILYFSATDGAHGYELWKTDGTGTGTILVRDIRTAPTISSLPEHVTNVNGVVYFTAIEDATGRELYKTDGTGPGTIMVKDIRPGKGSSGVENMTAVNAVLFFTANDGKSGHELWKSSGTASGTVLVKDMTPGFEGSHGESQSSFRMANFKNISGTLFYTAYKGDDYYIWTSNGTTVGTVARYPVGGPGNLQPRPVFTQMNGMVFFFNRDSEYWYSLFKTDLKASWIEPERVADLRNDAEMPYYPDMAVVKLTYGNRLYFNATLGPLGGGSITLLISDGSEWGTEAINIDPHVATASSSPNRFMPFKGKIAFIAEATFYGSSNIFITDGTAAGTRDVAWFTDDGTELVVTNNFIYGSGGVNLEIYKTAENYPGPYGYSAWYSQAPPAQNLTAVGEDIYFTNGNDELWVIDGETSGFELDGEGLSLLKTIHTMSELKSLGTNLIFRIRTAANGEELWRSNGTVAGTLRYKMLRAGEGTPPLFSPSTTIGRTHYFIANDGIHGNEIWRTQGSGSTTYMLADLNTNDPVLASGLEYDISTFVGFRDSLYISAIGNDGKWSLFKSKNYSTTVSKVTNINAVKMMVPARNKLYLFAYGTDQRTGLSLWKTNGTAAGTTLLRELPASDNIQYYIVDDILYFNLNNGSSLWRSDGTECGTYSFQTGIPSFNLTGISSTLLFNGYILKIGMEPYIYNTALIPDRQCDTALARSSSDEQKSAGYPNPFTEDFVLHVPGADNELVNVSIRTITGSPVETLEMISANTDYHIGQAWPPGMYIMKVQSGKNVWSTIILKK